MLHAHALIYGLQLAAPSGTGLLTWQCRLLPTGHDLSLLVLMHTTKYLQDPPGLHAAHQWPQSNQLWQPCVSALPGAVL